MLARNPTIRSGTNSGPHKRACSSPTTQSKPERTQTTAHVDTHVLCNTYATCDWVRTKKPAALPMQNEENRRRADNTTRRQHWLCPRHNGCDYIHSTSIVDPVTPLLLNLVCTERPARWRHPSRYPLKVIQYSKTRFERRDAPNTDYRPELH